MIEQYAVIRRLDSLPELALEQKTYGMTQKVDHQDFVVISSK